MTARRVVQLLVCVLATFTVAIAQPKKGAPAPKPAPAKDPVPAAGSAGSAGSAAGAEVQPVEEELPPADMEGTDENPGAPRAVGTEEPKVVAKAPEKKAKTSGYPMQEVLRPITLPQNMAEVSIGPRAQFDAEDVGYVGSDALRARYGITRQVQLGFTYTLGGIYDEPGGADKIGFHPGKAIGLDVTYLVKDFIGVKLGVPVWIYRPKEGGAPAIGVTLGVPVKFHIGDKLAIGGLDDLLAIKITRFAPSFEHEYLNAYRAAADDINTPASRGFFRLSGYAAYQKSPQLALIGRFGITFEDFVGTSTQSDRGGGSVTMIRAGVEYTVKKYLDVGITLGFEDLSVLGSFGPTTLLAFRI